jgi:toxin CptA
MPLRGEADAAGREVSPRRAAGGGVPVRLVVDLKPSASLAGLLIAAHLAAAACLVPLALAWELKVCGVAMLGASLAFHLLRDAGLRLSNSIVVFETHGDADCAITLRSGEWLHCDLLGTTFVTPWLTVINLRPQLRRWPRHVVILPDAAAVQDFRRLRVWLRWRRST